jgi:hypothetical protein
MIKYHFIELLGRFVSNLNVLSSIFIQDSICWKIIWMFKQCYLQFKTMDCSYSILHIASIFSSSSTSVGFYKAYWVAMFTFHDSRHDDDNNTTVTIHTVNINIIDGIKSYFHQLWIYSWYLYKRYWYIR